MVSFSSLAEPTKRKGMGSCTAKDHLLWVSYSVGIGVPYNGGAVCDDILMAIIKPISFYKCVEDANGQIHLWFNSDHNNAEMLKEGKSFRTIEAPRPHQLGGPPLL